MPFRLTPDRTKIQFLTAVEIPALINEALPERGAVSNTHYINLAICRALAEDLGLDYEGLVESLPPHKGQTGVAATPATSD